MKSMKITKTGVYIPEIKKENKEKVAKKLSELFELNYENVLKKVNKRSSIETIARKIDKQKADDLRIWMEQNNIISGINIDEDTKRYYPYNDLAAQVIGFTGSDNQGLDGVEAKYDSELEGKKGSIQRHTDARGGEIGTEGEKYVSAINGNDLILTIDLNIQSIVEKYLKEACIDNKCTDGGNIVAMNPKTGDILAMATYPTYNLNDPYSAYTEELKQNWNIMEERLGRLEMDQRQQLNNKVVSKVKKVQDRVLRRFTIVVLCLPFFSWHIVHNQMCDFSMLTWILLFLFVAVILARQLTWMLLLRKIDCLKMTVREVCLAESRFRMSFKVGIAVSVLCAVPLLVSMIWDMSQMGDHYLLIGVWTGLVVGMLIGIRLFLKAWSGIKELKEVITDLQ